MRQGVAFLTGAGMGAALMFAMDPASGNRRRRRMRHGLGDAAARAVGRGGSGASEDPFDEDPERRAPGPWSASGDAGVWDGRFDHFEGDRPRRIPGHRERARGERILLGAAGGALLAYSLRRRFPVSSTLGSMGLSLLASSITNRDIRETLGIGTGRRGIILDRTIIVNAPREHVYREWSRPENFPRFMSHIREVQDLGNGRSRWVVDGPAGLPVTWDAVTTRLEENEAIAWKSERSPVRNAGIVHFEPLSRGGTRVRMRFSYNPPAGFLGHLAAKLGGADPDLALDEDLARFRSYIEGRGGESGSVEHAGGRAEGSTPSFTPGFESQGGL